MREIGAYEAKTRLSELLELVRQGESFTVTHRGTPVAMLVPIERKRPLRDVIADLRRFRRGRKASAGEVRQWIEEGRRY